VGTIENRDEEGREEKKKVTRNISALVFRNKEGG
jgi:hypothetical protein